MPHKRKDLKIEGPTLWYFVGLITSDGCLSPDGRHIDITSSDYEFLQGVKRLIGVENKVGIKYDQNKEKKYFHIQLANRNFYDFLLSIGLTPRKSLTLRQIKIPKTYFLDFLRGVIDGDGGILRWIHSTNKREQWKLRVSSGSMKFLKWLQDKIEEIIKVKGKLYTISNTQFKLKYGKMAARIIAQKCYYEGCFGLQRKLTLARDCATSYRGWNRSKTINF